MIVVRALALMLIVVSKTVYAEDCERVEVWREAKRSESICRADTEARGMTVIDLGDDWTPPVLGVGDDGAGPAYRTTYLALAQERFADAGADAELAARDRYLELYGIAPALAVVRARLADTARHACHAAIEGAAIAAAPDRIVEESAAAGRMRITRARTLRAALERDTNRKQLADLEALGDSNQYYRRAVDRLNTIEAHIAAVRAVQAHLACDGLVEQPAIDGAYTWQTSNAVARFQRGAMILPSAIVDAQTREALLLDSRERDFRTALRVLRERVAAAAGLIEDGTAGAGEGAVLGRVLVPGATWGVRGHALIEGAAPDLIAPATEAAARALGWTDAAALRAFLDGESGVRTVAVQLPAPPAYHASAMELAIEIDRGDVHRDVAARWRQAARRPALIVYAIAGDRRIALARWPTTIGGWQRQKIDGAIALRWKESPVGPRIWRDLYVGPSWLPPASTPDRELVRRAGGGFVLAREQLGPSYRAAFGMVAFVHLVEGRGDERWDQGIRTHGTGNLTSVATGVSHGCHRLLGYHVVRLADFVLAHRAHARRGDTPTYYRRVVRAGGDFRIAIDSLGYRIELTPPIPVHVLPGRIAPRGEHAR